MTAEETIEDRCRLVLVTPAGMALDDLGQRLTTAGKGGDIASVIVPEHGLDEGSYQRVLETLVPVCQAFGAAVIAAGEPRLAARTGADGIHVRSDAATIKRAVETHQDRFIIGAEAGKTRHQALEVGEARPDYVLFGRPGGDTHAEAHPRVAEQAAWWAELVEIPAILMGGHDLTHLDAAAATGVDFIALSRAILAPDVDAERAVREANQVLATHRLVEAA